MSTTPSRSLFPILVALVLPLVWALSACTSQPGVKQALTQTSNATRQVSQKADSKPVTQKSVEKTGTQALAATKPETPAASEQQIAAAISEPTAGEKVEISFLPLKGIPQTAQTKLSKQLYGSAGKYDVNLLNQNQPRSNYGLTGYFTALNDGSGTLLIYVWDIVDRNGKRLHRINGQERSGGTSPDPWRSIDDKQLTDVADHTMQSVQTWIASRKG